MSINIPLFLDNAIKIAPLLKTIILLSLVFIFLNFILKLIRKALLKKAKTKKHISDVKIFYKVFNTLLIVVLVLLGISSYTGSLVGFGLGLGLFTAALGWALQRPITGIAAWVMIVVKRPFEIGDRIIIGNVKGDVMDISFTHIYLKELGGLIGGEERSGRIIMIPNSILFEQIITNYTLQEEDTLDQVVLPVTFESNLDKAIKLALESAEKHLEGIRRIKKKPYIRTYFQPNGVNIHVRYFVPAQRVQEISSKITKEILDRIKMETDIRIAYPHTEVIIKNHKEKAI